MPRHRTSPWRFNPHALRAWREERGIRTGDMAVALGITPGYYCDLETGRRPGTAPLLQRASEFLAVPKLALVENPSVPEAEA